MRSPTVSQQLVVCLLVVGAAVGVPSGTEAKTFTVDSDLELHDSNAGDGVCLATLGMSGVCTLRAAVEEANAFPGHDTVVVPEAIYALSSRLRITEDVTVEGAGAWGTVVTIAEGFSDRIFRVVRHENLTVTDLTLRGGTAAQGDLGGAAGGAVVGDRGRLEFSRVWFDGNTAFSCGAVHLTDGTLTVTDSTFSHNSATRDGGALCMSNGTTASITNSTFYRNSAASAGAIDVSGHIATSLTLTSSTLVDNLADDESSAILVGIAGLHIDKTLIRGGCVIEESASVTSDGGNAESPGNTCLIGAPGDQPNLTSAQLQLGTLADYGGPVPTILPGTQSRAVDPGLSNASCPSTDARGEPRVGSCDVGAVERQLDDPETGPLFEDGFESGDTSRWQ